MTFVFIAIVFVFMTKYPDCLSTAHRA